MFIVIEFGIVYFLLCLHLFKNSSPLFTLVLLFAKKGVVIEETVDVLSSSCFIDCFIDLVLLCCGSIMLGIVDLVSWFDCIVCKDILICMSCFDESKDFFKDFIYTSTFFLWALKLIFVFSLSSSMYRPTSSSVSRTSISSISFSSSHNMFVSSSLLLFVWSFSCYLI